MTIQPVGSVPTQLLDSQAAAENVYQDSGSSPPQETGVATASGDTNPSQGGGTVSKLARVASGQRRKGRKSMSRRSGQKGQVVKKGSMWHVRFYVDVAGQEKRQRRSVPIGPCKGKNKLTKPEAERKGAEIIASLGVNTIEHLERATNLSPVVTFRQRVEWCRRYHKAWTDGKPSSI